MAIILKKRLKLSVVNIDFCVQPSACVSRGKQTNSLFS